MRVNFILNDKERKELNRYKNENLKLHRKLKQIRQLLAQCVNVFDNTYFTSDSSTQHSIGKNSNRKHLTKPKNIGERRQLTSKYEKQHTRSHLIPHQSRLSSTKVQRIASSHSKSNNKLTDISSVSYNSSGKTDTACTTSDQFSNRMGLNISSYWSSSPSLSAPNDEIEMYDTANDSNSPNPMTQPYFQSNAAMENTAQENDPNIKDSDVEMAKLNDSNNVIAPQSHHVHQRTDQSYLPVLRCDTSHQFDECKFQIQN